MAFFKPYSSLTEAPTNLKEAIDWVLRVTGRDGKKLDKDKGECICGLAAAVTDLLQSVELEYNGYDGDGNISNGNKSPQKCFPELFSLVQGPGGTAVVRTYIDQLAQVLSALVGWSRIEKCKFTQCKGEGNQAECKNNGNAHNKDKCCCKALHDKHKGSTGCCKVGGNKKKGMCANGCCSHYGPGCKYIADVVPNDTSCETCGCIKGGDPSHLGRGCQRCSDSEEEKKKQCQCEGGKCIGTNKCQCAEKGKCCKCCCTNCTNCKDEEERLCSCYGYRSAYRETLRSWVDGGGLYRHKPTWKDLLIDSPEDTSNGTEKNDGLTPSHRRLYCAKILLGSVCLIWSGITYMYWTGKCAESSPRWNNHILDGSGLDDGTLSQWLQALGFPKSMLNNNFPGNRLDAVISTEFMIKFFLGFPDTSYSNVHGQDNNANTFRSPANLTYAGFIHKIDKGVFDKEGTDKNIDPNKHGPLYKLYILSCAYFTGLQRKTSESTHCTTPRTPKTIREILYWLSALPYSTAYKGLLYYSKEKQTEVTKDNPNKYLSFHQIGRTASINVQDVDLYSHFQAVTQYCPLVLIGIQGGIHSTQKSLSNTDSTPSLYSLYANFHFSFSYPALPIQAYNQVVHYIRGLFYQLYFLRKQCAVKVTSGGKWRECRYGSGVVSKGVVSWMCLGCNPMEHDRKSRVDTVNGVLKKVVPQGNSNELVKALKDLLEKIGEVVVQLGNTQEALERKEKGVVIGKVKKALGEAKQELEKVNKDGLSGKLGEAKKKLEELTNGSKGKLNEVETKLEAANSNDFGQGKNKISDAVNGVRKALEALKEGVEELKEEDKENVMCAVDEILEVYTDVNELEKVLQKEISQEYTTLLHAIEKLISICSSPKCLPCQDHANKCGKQPQSKYCNTCHQQYMDGFPSPLQAFLEDRLTGFSCDVVRNDDKEQPDYPLASDHLYHSNGSGQCCPLPMGFRGHFQGGSTSDSTGARIHGTLCFFSNGDMMQSCVYRLVRLTAELSATTPQVLGDVFGFFRGGVGNNEEGEDKSKTCSHDKHPSKDKNQYFCGWCASGLRDEVKKIEWIYNGDDKDKGGKYRGSVGQALIKIKGQNDSHSGTGVVSYSGSTYSTNKCHCDLSSLSDCTQDGCAKFISPLTGELYTAVSATFGGTYLSWVLYLSDALEGGLRSLSDAFKEIECRGCKGQCDPNKCKKGGHGATGNSQCNCSSIVSCTGVLPVLYRHGFSYGNPFNLEGYRQGDGSKDGDYGITENKNGKKHCHEFLASLQDVIKKKEEEAASQSQDQHPLTNLITQVGQLQYDIRLPWIFVLTVAWLLALLYLAFGAIWPLDWTHMRSHWLRGGEHQWQCMWYKVMTGRKGVELVEYFGRKERE